ncbi:hypothetical protein NIES4074_06140 [Cylindrospermum sp. NIES-4074]|nr:hypothetical protein NIES4074_06140 [Cylindrospermum sp. NIES-4074]
MTSRADETQKLIADIDNLLASSGKRLSRLLSGQAQEPKEVLQRVRDFLVRLGESEVSEESVQSQSSEQPLSPLLARFVEQGNNQSPSESPQLSQEQSTFEVGQLKSEFSVLIQPLQAELSGLLQERATLVQEIRQLEQRRLQNFSLTQQLANQEQMISEFLQVLMNRLVPNLTSHLGQNLANSPASTTVSENAVLEPVTPAAQPFLESSDQVEQLARLARELDQRLVSLDGTVNVVFEAIQRNINTYHQSLSQALARMHSQGMQGEQLMASFLNNLTQYLQQQSLVFQPSFLEVENQTLPSSPPSLDLVEVQPASSSAEVTTQKLELIQLNQVSLPANSPETEATAITEDMEAVLSPLGTDEPPTSNIPTVTSTSVELVGDEVDELYASLFGNKDSVNLDVGVTPQAVINELSVVETVSSSQEAIANNTLNLDSPEAAIANNTLNLDSPEAAIANNTLNLDFPEEAIANNTLNLDSPEEAIANNTLNLDFPEEAIADNTLNLDFPEEAIADNTPVTPSNIEDSVVSLPDPWVEEADNNAPSVEIVDAIAQSPNSSSQLWETLFFEENTQPQSEVTATDSFSEELDSQPSSYDTITVLTDLLVDVGSSQQLPEVVSLVNHQATIAPKTPVVKSEVVIQNEVQEHPLDNYIPASPQENLLSLEEMQPSTVSDIVLDTEQLQQLDRDLANFDVLDTEQLQQLDRDLANFDQQVNSPSQPITNLDELRAAAPSSQQVENTSTVAFSGLEIPQPEADVDFSPKIEKKKEATIPEEESSWLSISNSINNDVPHNVVDGVWYLGIDLGTTGISAALLNRSGCVVYPIYWSAEDQPSATSFQQSYRLPAEVYLPRASVPHSETESTEGMEQIAPAAVAQDKTSENLASTSVANPTNNLYSAQLKPYLQVAIPYKNTKQKWEPVLQLNDFSAGPLIWVVRSLSKLLLTLKSHQASTTPALIANAVGLDAQTFLNIINNIAGVVCTCPTSWSEQYRFNVREALLNSKLVSHPQQVLFVEEAIASLLPELDSANAESVQLSDRQGLRPLKNSTHPLIGNTLSINIGATATEMALVDLPENLGQLTHNDFMLHGFAYAGKGIEQDIICQLLLPPKSRQPRSETLSDSTTTSNNPWHWQPATPGIDQMQWQSLGLEGLELPRVGEPDITARIRLQQRLESSLLGQAVLDAALALKLILQHQESFTLELADQRWVLQRRELESQVFVPFVRRLNRELNKLLVARGIPTEAINQAIVTGGVAAIGTVNRWLRQKLPNAKIIQDSYLGENGAPNCSRVAYGLAMLPLHPQVLDVPRQQYTDYFLFTELLRLLPDRSLSFSEVIQLFEGRGINTRTCQQRLLAFLEGELPSGLIPSTQDSTWLTQNSQQNPDYQAIAAIPLFEKQGSLTYRPNSQQLLSLGRYLSSIKASTQQSLEEPYTVNFVLAAQHQD